MSRYLKCGTAESPASVRILGRSKPATCSWRISGERYDGHDFVPEAVRAGGGASLVSAEWDNERSPGDARYGARIVVAEVLQALQAFARWHRVRFDLPVIAVTGSSGKTTTKDIIADVLGRRFRVFKTPGNLNSQLGASEALCKLGKEHEVAVLELGMNRAGELDRLAHMVRPTVGVITNVGPAHIEFFDSIEGIARAKGEILDHLPPDGTAVLNADDSLVMAEGGRSSAPIITFGRSSEADIRLAACRTDLTGSSFSLSDGSSFRISLMGGAPGHERPGQPWRWPGYSGFPTKPRSAHLKGWHPPPCGWSTGRWAEFT